MEASGLGPSTSTQNLQQEYVFLWIRCGLVNKTKERSVAEEARDIKVGLYWLGERLQSVA